MSYIGGRWFGTCSCLCCICYYTRSGAVIYITINPAMQNCVCHFCTCSQMIYYLKRESLDFSLSNTLYEAEYSYRFL